MYVNIKLYLSVKERGIVMKKILGYSMLLFCLCLFLLVFSACGAQVRFRLNFVVDGEVYDTIDTAGREAISMPQNPTKAGDEFDGWYWDEGTWERPFTANSLLDTPLSSDMNVYAKWKSDDAQKVEPSAASIVSAPAFEINGNALSLTFPNATESYSFLGQITVSTGANWQVSTDMQGLNAIPTKTVPLNPGDNTFYLLVTSANGEGVSLYTVTVRRRPIYTVSFNANGGDSVAAMRAEEDSTINPPKTTRTGYSFAGWDYDFTQPIKGNLTTAAKWTSNTDTSYTVEYYLQNAGATGYDLAERVPLMGTTASTVTAEQKTYPHFTYKSSGSKSSGTIAPDGSLVLKLYYTRDTYTVTFVGDGGTLESGNATQTVRYGNAATLPTFARKGYTFTGWDKESNAVAEDLTVTAQWEINHYSIIYNLNDGINAESNPATYTVEDTVVLTAPKRTGYTFEGWSDNGTIALGSTGDKTFSANWKTISYTITYDLGGGTNAGGNPATYTIEDDVILATPTRTGYTFAGWSNGGKVDAGSTGDMTFAASWEIITYTITYDLGGGINAESNPMTYTVEDDVTLVEPTWEYGRFLGWYTASDEKIENLNGNAGDLSLTAKWECFFTLSGNSITGISAYCKNNVTEIVIPASLNETAITGIAANAFANYTGLTSVVIPDGVTSIGNYAFRGCTGLTSVTIPDSVTSIGAGVFSGCSSLANITIPFVGWSRKTASNTYQYPFGYIFGTSSYTGSVATTQYYYGSSTSSTTSTTYNIPSSLKSVTVTGGYIPYGAFYNCSGLASITIGNSVTSIGNSAFYNCTCLTEVTIGNGITSIGDYAFQNCTGLTSVTIPDSVTSIGWSAFFGCSGLTSVTIPDSVTSIGQYAFSGCSGLTSIAIPDSVTSIGNYAFRGCTGLTSIAIPDSVTSIGQGAFGGCSALQSITIPFVGGSRKTASNTYQYPFGYIFGTSSYTGGVATNQSYYGSSTSSATNTTYYIPSSLKSVTVTGGDILYGAFYGCSELTSIAIPDSVTSIGNNAFYNCSGLTAVYYTGDVAGWCGITFASSDANPLYYAHNLYINGELVTDLVVPNGVTSIGQYAFSGCTGLTSITIPDSVTSIGELAFYNCFGLTSITIPDSVTSIGAGAFFYCYGLTSITIPDSVESIEYGAFEGCSGLTSVTIPDSVTSIGESAFVDCSGLTSITVAEGNPVYHSAGNCIIVTASKTLLAGCKTSVIPTDGSVTSIGELAFYNCFGLTSITIPDSVESIEYGAFSDCTGLTSVTIGNGVRSIGDYAFYYCTGLTSITIPDSVASIGYGAFCYTGLTSINIPNSVTSIGSYAFFHCFGLTSITIPDSVTSIGEAAFSGCSGITSITFTGTMAQWNAIGKGSYWNSNTGNYTIHCTDGDISINLS